LLEFAPAKDAPQLFDSATGKLALYFRGKNDRFFAAYYDTNSAKAKYLLAADTGNLTFIARSAEPEMDAIAISVSDSDGKSPSIGGSGGQPTDTCTLTITQRTNRLNGNLVAHSPRCETACPNIKWSRPRAGLCR
jgi:hypothetical protein